MQETRQHILEILREHGEATVDDLVAQLQQRWGKDITAVTVRHHLHMLQREALITAPQMRHRSTPGRPQHVYALTEKARELFPNNYQQLATRLLSIMRETLPPQGVNVIVEGVVSAMAQEAQIPEAPICEKLDFVVDFLNKQGYRARWQSVEDGYMLHTANCPYHHLAKEDHTLCDMDMRLVSTLLGIVPRVMGRVAQGDQNCSYFIPYEASNN
jgi:DeoR family transcriptional regulator, suf operon transcriptional repressor